MFAFDSCFAHRHRRPGDLAGGVLMYRRAFYYTGDWDHRGLLSVSILGAVLGSQGLF
jgi:hypothetical protein